MSVRPGTVLHLGPTDFDANSLVVSMVVSSIGFVAWRYGRAQQRFPQMAAGLLLMGFTWFVSDILLMVTITALILLLMWVAIRMGL